MFLFIFRLTGWYLLTKMKPYKSKWNNEISKPRISIIPGFRSIISTRIQLTTSRIAKPSTKSCCWFRVVFKLNRILIGCTEHQSESENFESFQSNEWVSKLDWASNATFIKLQRTIASTILWRGTNSTKKRSWLWYDLIFRLLIKLSIKINRFMISNNGRK